MASIIDKKYAERYKNADKDWAAQFIDRHVVVQHEKEIEKKDEQGNVVGTEIVALKKTGIDLDKLFALADQNKLETDTLKAQRANKNAPGRIRMTIGNQLRAAAKHRHGLFDTEGVWHDAPAEFIGDAAKTHNPDGSRIVPEKQAAEAA